MALDTPTTVEIRDNIVAQLEATLAQTVPVLPKAFIRVLAATLAGVFITLYKYAGFIALQQFIQTATIEETTILGRTIRPLVEWGRLIGVGEPDAPTQAELQIDITVTNQTGSLEAGTVMLSTANGVTYLLTSTVDLLAPTVSAVVRASGDQSGGDGSGVIGNLQPGDIVSFANPLGQVERNAVVVTQTVTGADGESEEAYRARVLERWQARLQGGASADYRAWATDVEGIIKAYPYTAARPGEVDVYCEATPESSGDPDGIPTQAQLEAVLESIRYEESGLASRRPTNARANVYPIYRSLFEVVVGTLTVDNVAETQANIQAALEEWISDFEPYIVGLSVGLRQDQITEVAAAGVVQDVVFAAGGTVTDVILKLNNAAVTLYTLSEGEKAKVTVTFA